jgi:hypothetical protein
MLQKGLLFLAAQDGALALSVASCGLMNPGTATGVAAPAAYPLKPTESHIASRLNESFATESPEQQTSLLRRAREPSIWKLEPSFRCRSCGTRRYKPPVRMIKLLERWEISDGCILMRSGEPWNEVL